MNTPVPEWAENAAQEHRGRHPKYPLRTMDLYEVFSVPSNLLPPSGYKGFKLMLNNRGSDLGRRFVSRQLDDGTVEVCRVK